MKRVVSVVEVVEVALWAELDARVPLADHLGEVLSATARVSKPSFEKVVMPKLAEAGVPVLARWARRSVEPEPESEVRARIAAVDDAARRVLYNAQRHAIDGVVRGVHAWDPAADARAVRVLHGAGLIDDVPGVESAPYAGLYLLNGDLPPPPPVPYDFADAAMGPVDDLGEARPGPVGLLHDLAALAVAIEATRPKRTLGGGVARADVKRLGARLGVPSLTVIEDDPRWGRALRALEALRGIATDPVGREVHLDVGLDVVLHGETADAVDALVHRLVEPDLHTAIPAVRAALAAAGDGAVDEVVFFELVRSQHRDVLFPWWGRGRRTYPTLGEEAARPYDDAGFEAVELPMLHALLGRLGRLGLLRRAPGAFAATEDGRLWARVTDPRASPLWVSGDLEVVLPPNAVTPGERFSLERLGRCLGRDVVDRFKLDKKGLEIWLASQSVDEAVALLRRRAPGVPRSVEETLRAWATSLSRVTLTRGVVLEAVTPP